MNILTGSPRSGSTLLCNILNQNPDNYASDTSVLSAAVKSITTAISEQPEAQEIEYERIKKSIKAFIKAWYVDYQDKVIYDKGRGWSQMGLIYKDLDLGKMYVLVRDIRDVYASCEKAHAKNPLLSNSTLIASNNMYDRADIMCSPEGIIGSAVKGIEDLIRRNLDNVVFIQYEALCANPKRILSVFDDFEYHFKNIKNVSKENDKLYHNKYPHKGDGEVTTKSIGSWRGTIDNGLAKVIYDRFPFYNERFGY